MPTSAGPIERAGLTEASAMLGNLTYALTW
jgi:hypothetical protein